MILSFYCGFSLNRRVFVPVVGFQSWLGVCLCCNGSLQIHEL